VQTLRVICSIQVQSTAEVMITLLSRMSIMVQGWAGRSRIAKVVMSARGKARPMASQSTTGSPSREPARNGWKPLLPPTSHIMIALNFLPMCSSIMVMVRAISGPSTIFSCIAIGAPIWPMQAIASSSSSDSGSISSTDRPAPQCWRASSSEKYGSPPPPVPRIQEPIAKASRSSIVIFLGAAGIERILLRLGEMTGGIMARRQRAKGAIFGGAKLLRHRATMAEAAAQWNVERVGRFALEPRLIDHAGPRAAAWWRAATSRSLLRCGRTYRARASPSIRTA
jgi:hypothetical protein